MKLTWLGHSGFKIKDSLGRIIYIDPYELSGKEEKADIIFFTHVHDDHYSKKDVAKLRKKETKYVTTPDNLETNNIRVLLPGEYADIDGISVEAVPAYNINKEYHPKDRNWVGYIITIDGVRIYHAGDSDVIPEMKRIKADVCLMPVSGMYTMTAEEAAGITSIIRPKIAIPMHYGSHIGSKKDAETFKDILDKKRIRVEILKKRGSIDI